MCLVFCMSLIARCLRNHVGPAKTDFTRVVCTRQVLHTLVVLYGPDCLFDSGSILVTLRVALYVDPTSCRLNLSPSEKSTCRDRILDYRNTLTICRSMQYYKLMIRKTV